MLTFELKYTVGGLLGLPLKYMHRITVHGMENCINFISYAHEGQFTLIEISELDVISLLHCYRT